MKKFLKYSGITILSVITILYVLFLIIPFGLNGIVNSYGDEISKLVEETCGFKIKVENIRILTTPKLTAGVKAGHFEAALPTGEAFLIADNVQGKMSLIPLILRKFELDKVSADNINVNLKIKKDGKFLIEDYIVQAETGENETAQAELPLGIKLSNHLPDIIINNYNISFVDIPTDKTYAIYGDKVSVKDFILNKKVRVSADGKVMLQDRVQFSYDMKIFNKVMPDLDLNELVFNPSTEESANQSSVSVNLIDIFKAIYKNQLTADLKGDIVTSGTFDDMDFDGNVNVSNLSVAVDGKKLPSSSIDLKLKGNSIYMFTNLYTAQNELTEIIGNFKTGKHPNIDLNCKSNAQFKSLIDMLDSIAKSFGYKELDTLTATGGINADFNVKSNLKKVESSGYLKIPSASLAYGLYNLFVKNINADIDFANNMINIKNAGLTVAGQPLKITGSISELIDVSVLADKLSIKELMAAAGQGAILKENSFNNGTLTLQADLKGKLNDIVPDVNLSVDNLKIKNLPSGLILSVPVVKVKCNMDNISIDNSYILLDNTHFDISGKISDYLTQTIKLDLSAVSDGAINLKGNVINAKKLDLNLSTSKTLSMEIPTLKKSNVKADANISISGNIDNPTLKGTAAISSLSIPDMSIALENLDISLNGPIVKGNGKLNKFTTGGIIAENLSADFNLANNIFYLKNITGEAFSGKVSGDVSYNLANGHIVVGFKGSELDAEKAIAGAAGIKNALSGKLGFDADVTLHGATDTEMIKNLQGKVSFEILDGAFGNIGRFENFLLADNISSNSILKAAVNSVSSLPAIKNTAEFKSVSGDLTFNNGWANLNPIKTTGPSMAYYITGKYNLLNGTANIVILGRLSAEVVKLLGVLGDLSVDKLTSFIPKFGSTTATIINALTTNPADENVSAIPDLSSGDTNYKDFKVQFNGGVESNSSVKSFKWLSNCDTSALETVTVKEQVQNTKAAVKEAYEQKAQEVAEKLEQQREQAQEAKNQMQNAVEGLKNLKNLLK